MTTQTKIGWIDALRPRYFRAPSVLILVVANLLPLYGVLYWGWDLYSLMVLYWMETGIIGLFAIIEMAIAARALALFLVPFFIVHFGGFMLGHIFFLTLMFGSGTAPDGLSRIPDLVWTLLAESGLWIALAALFISHGISFVLNVLRPAWRAWREHAGQLGFSLAMLAPTGNPHATMFAPYGRIVVMHVTIIFGALLAEVFRTKTAAFVLLIGLKTAVDMAAHVRKNFRPGPDVE
jgi:hypothetical protein